MRLSAASPDLPIPWRGRLSLGLTSLLLALLSSLPAIAQSMEGVVPEVPVPTLEPEPGILPGVAPSMGGTAPVQFPPGTGPNQAGLPTDYRLGPGDVIAITVFGAEDYSGNAIVLQNGAINLPRVGTLMVGGLTFPEVTRAIATRYSPYIQQPLVTVSPVSLRPVRIAISGEVRRPGAYTIAANTGGDSSTTGQSSRFPTLTEAIGQAGGITGLANIRDVQLRRPAGHGRMQVETFDLWNLIQSGDLSQDIVLMSGDEIVVPTAVAISPREATAVSEASIAPDSIRVYITGEVKSPGLLEVPLNTPLNQAILNAGGFNPRASGNAVQLVHVNADGTVTQRDIDVDFDQDINEVTNPVLADKDVVIVGRSGLATFGDAASIVLSPVTQILNTILGLQNLLF